MPGQPDVTYVKSCFDKGGWTRLRLKDPSVSTILRKYIRNTLHSSYHKTKSKATHLKQYVSNHTSCYNKMLETS